MHEIGQLFTRRRDVFGEDMTPHRLRAMAAFLVEKLGFGSAVARDVLGHIDASVLRRSCRYIPAIRVTAHCRNYPSCARTCCCSM